MQSHNKKGQFFPLFVVVIPVILAAILLVMSMTEAKRDDLIGQRAGSIIKVYDEAQKIDFFISLSAKHAEKLTLKELAKNGGYNKNNRCEKTEIDLVNQEQYVIINTCPVLDVNEEFTKQFKNELKSFFEMYTTSYSNVDLNSKYQKAVREANILEITAKDKDLLITISDISLDIENTQDSAIKLTPKIKIKNPDLKVYDKLYAIINTSCINKDFSSCSSKIKAEFPSAQVYQDKELTKINIPLDEYEIKLAVMSNAAPINSLVS